MTALKMSVTVCHTGVTEGRIPERSGVVHAVLNRQSHSVHDA